MSLLETALYYRVSLLNNTSHLMMTVYYSKYYFLRSKFIHSFRSLLYTMLCTIIIMIYVLHARCLFDSRVKMLFKFNYVTIVLATNIILSIHVFTCICH